MGNTSKQMHIAAGFICVHLCSVRCGHYTGAKPSWPKHLCQQSSAVVFCTQLTVYRRAKPIPVWRGAQGTHRDSCLLVSNIRSPKIFSIEAMFLEEGVESRSCCRYDILSPGEMQRLSFARLFYLQPKYAGEQLTTKERRKEYKAFGV